VSILLFLPKMLLCWTALTVYIVLKIMPCSFPFTLATVVSYKFIRRGQPHAGPFSVSPYLLTYRFKFLATLRPQYGIWHRRRAGRMFTVGAAPFSVLSLLQEGNWPLRSVAQYCRNKQTSVCAFGFVKSGNWLTIYGSAALVDLAAFSVS
jgi:hypothetical protein